MTRREPKQLGSPGQFHLWAEAQNFISSSTTDEGMRSNNSSKAGNANSVEGSVRGHAIRSIRCNADGTRVSILADHVRDIEMRSNFIREDVERIESCGIMY